VNRLTISALAACVAIVTPASFALAEQDTALMKVANSLGYVYSYLGPEDAASLSRPGVTVVIRPGQQLFDVNDRTEAVEGPPPRFALSDIYVSQSLVARLRQIAALYPARVADRAIAGTISVEPAATSGTTGSITNLRVSQIAGQQQIAVDGNAPARYPVTLTLLGTFSSDLPDVILSRHLVTADTNGTFQSAIPLAGGYYRGAILTLVASSIPGITSTKSQFEAKAPNAAVSVPADATPRSIR